MSKESTLIKIGAAWKGKDKNGQPMLTGKMGDARLVILANGFKDGEKHPDYIVYVAPFKPKDDAPATDSDEVPF